MIKENKKGNFGLSLFAFFFLLTIISGLMLFLGVFLHYVFYDYGMQPALDLVDNLQISGAASTNIDNLAESYLNSVEWIDYFFLVTLVSIFITGIISSIRARQVGIFSFFGLTTIGMLFLIFILGIAINIRGWFLNNFVYNIITIGINMPIMTFFYNWTIEICIFMFLVFLSINQLDLTVIREKFNALFNRDTQQNENRFNIGGGKFEE